MKRVLLTGATGFVGSVVSLSLLDDEEVHLFSLANNDPSGEVIKKSIMDAAAGFNVDTDVEGRITSIHIDDFNNIDLLERKISEVKPDEVWNIAAHMSYSIDEFVPSFQFNVVTSSKLIEFCSRFAKHIYHISTTGVAGPGSESGQGREVPENTLWEFDVCNPYTVSKCLAEYTISEVSKRNKVNLTILRLGCVIGHSDTGWVNDTKYGYYSYLYMLKRIHKKKREFYLNIDPDKKFPVIHVNHFADYVKSLRARENRENLEIFHVCNQNPLTVKEHFEVFEELSDGFKIRYGEGETSANKNYNYLNRDNNRFLSTNHSFSFENSKVSLGEGNVPPECKKNFIKNIINGFLEK